MRRVAGWEASEGGKMSDRPAADVSRDWLGCDWGDMGAGAWGCKMSDIWDAPGPVSDKFGVAV